MPKYKQKGPIRNKDGNHVILILHKERQGHIHSLKSLREKIKHGLFPLIWSIVLKFECKRVPVYNKLRNLNHIFENLFM